MFNGDPHGPGARPFGLDSTLPGGRGVTRESTYFFLAPVSISINQCSLWAKKAYGLISHAFI